MKQRKREKERKIVDDVPQWNTDMSNYERMPLACPLGTLDTNNNNNNKIGQNERCSKKNGLKDHSDCAKH
ncbi:hypothetical protein BLOT_004142 [Blomia tropicalis]|nr:hypothetical protein BLOT_004142 [Blomia tropicalis]